MAKITCPSHDELSGYVRGTLPPEQAEAVTVHIAACANCEDTIHHLAAEPDNVVDQVKSASKAQPYVDEPECRKVVAAISKHAPVTVTGSAAPYPSQATEQVRPMNRS